MKLKNTILKLFLFGIVSAASLQFANAQDDKYPKEAGKYFVDTIYNKHYSYNLLVMAGLYADMDLATGGSPAGGGAYGYARYNILRRAAVSGFIGGAPIKIGNVNLASYYFVTELRGSIFLKRKYELQNLHCKLGQDGQYKYSCDVPVMAGSYLGITGSIGSQKRQLAVKDATKWQPWEVNNNGKLDTALTNHGGMAALVSYAQMSGGLYYSKSSNAKFKIYMNANGGRRKFTRRSKNAMDVAFEMLYAPIINVSTLGQYINGSMNYDDKNVKPYTFTNIKYKHMGWRMQANMKTGIMSYHIEMGGRPGARVVLDEKQRKILSFMDNFYMQIGIGFAIGAL